MHSIIHIHQVCSPLYFLTHSQTLNTCGCLISSTLTWLNLTLPLFGVLHCTDDVQLCQLLNWIKNSSTLILPHWKEAIKELTPTSEENLTVHKMPWDICTQWNSTYNMLKFAYKYQKVVNKITSKWSLKLRKYELSEGKWDLVKELWDCLKVQASN